MSIQCQGCERMLELPQPNPSSSSSTSNYAYPYVISSPSDAVDAPKAKAMAMNMKETIMSTIADSELGDDQIPVAQPWPESKSTSPPSAREEKEEDGDGKGNGNGNGNGDHDHDHDHEDIDAQLKVVLESLRDLYKESEILFKKVFFKNQHDHLLKKQKSEGQADPKRRASLELGKKRISRILKETKRNQTKAGMLQRSLSVDSPRTPLGRFKVKTLDLGGGAGGGGGPCDIKGSTKDG